MNNRNALKPVLTFIILTLGTLMLSACHAPQPAATEMVNLPVIEQEVRSPDVLADGTIRINKKLLVQHIGTEGVFILSTGNRARFRMVKAGKESGEWLSISSGLIGNEKILSGPYESIFDGSPVSVK